MSRLMLWLLTRQSETQRVRTSEHTGPYYITTYDGMARSNSTYHKWNLPFRKKPLVDWPDC